MMMVLIIFDMAAPGGGDLEVAGCDSCQNNTFKTKKAPWEAIGIKLTLQSPLTGLNLKLNQLAAIAASYYPVTPYQGLPNATYFNL